MIYQQISGIEQKVSTLCLGTMNFGVSVDENTSFRMMDAFLDMGGNFIDTARLYGQPDGCGFGAVEKVIGKWMRQSGTRQKVTLATKGGHPPIENMDIGRLDKANLTADLEDSLRDLGTDHIDLYWLHRDDTRLPVEEILGTLNDFIRQGKIGAIGASNWRAERLRMADQAARENGLVGFCGDQPMWSLARNDYQATIQKERLIQMDKDLYAFHQESGMACVPYTSQAKGFFSKMVNGGESVLSDKARQRYFTPHNLKLLETVKELCDETGLSAGALALAYMTAQTGFAGIPIVGVSRMEQVEALREAGDAVLTAEQVDRLVREAELA